MEPYGPGRDPYKILGGRMRLTESDILPIAEKTGFRVEMLEKVVLLLNLINNLNSHPFLKGKWVLKGGTALNLFLLDLPRLSIDIDLNYTGAVERSRMLEERPGMDQALKAVFSREGFNAKRYPEEHAGGKYRLGYQSITGQAGNLEVDINYMYRQTLWDISSHNSNLPGNFQAKNVPILDIHELAAGKIAALLSRGQARDLFDCYKIFKLDNLKPDLLRIAFVVYGGMNRKDWRNVSIEDIKIDPVELDRQLIPTLNMDILDKYSQQGEFSKKLLQDCKKNLSMVLPLKVEEMGFLDRLLDNGEIIPSILTSDEELIKRISNQPLLEWKALNVRKFNKK
jgi:predicted nucleotidyltransferase component of viral defense system